MRVVLALGSNLGDRLAHLQAAVDLLGATAVSPVFETEPVGGPEQQDYLNAVVLAEFGDDADPLAAAHAAERDQGRTRGVRWGPRTLDVDVLAVTVAGRPLLREDPRLTLPHPRAHERAFVLAPWAVLDPAAEIPGKGRVADLLAARPAAERAGVRRRDDLTLRVPGRLPRRLPGGS